LVTKYPVADAVVPVTFEIVAVTVICGANTLGAVRQLTPSFGGAPGAVSSATSFDPMVEATLLRSVRLISYKALVLAEGVVVLS
jgi:hypothetical protein